MSVYTLIKIPSVGETTTQSFTDPDIASTEFTTACNLLLNSKSVGKVQLISTTGVFMQLIIE